MNFFYVIIYKEYWECKEKYNQKQTNKQTNKQTKTKTNRNVVAESFEFDSKTVKTTKEWF